MSKLIISKDDWHPYPTISNRDEWKRVPEEMRNLHITEAEKYLDHKWEVLPASVFLEFARNGNRSNYSKIYTERRKTLSILVFAEIFENKDRFIDDIVNLTWAICEETFWGVPAHLGMQKAGVGLPDAEEPVVDLFAAETGSMLARVSYLVGEKLDKVSPLVQKRIHYEINRRILTPNLERTDFWWMGFGEENINNWNPWINSNWSACVLLCEEDNNRRIDALHKIMLSLDNFINGYPDDGGCDEGPQYCGKAAGALYLALELFNKASDSKAVLSMDISEANPAEANLTSRECTITLNRGKNIVIAEKYQLNKVTGRLSLNFMTVLKPDASIPGKIKITDSRLKNTWGNKVYRIVLRWKNPGIKGNCKTIVTKS